MCAWSGRCGVSRAGATALAILSLGVPLLLLIRKPWAARTVQLVLILAGFEWLRQHVSGAGVAFVDPGEAAVRFGEVVSALGEGRGSD